MKTINHSFG